jgi:hypothetical protein
MSLPRGVLPIVMLILTSGCESQDQRLVDYAQEATERQAEQNRAIANQSEKVTEQGQQLAETAQKLVEQDAIARRELIQAHDRSQQHLDEQQASVDQQRAALHAERQAVAKAALREPVIARALIVTGLILATLLPLIVTAYALYRLPDSNPQEALLSSALLDELAAMPTQSLPPAQDGPERPQVSAPRLPGPGQPGSLLCAPPPPPATDGCGGGSHG